MLGDQRRLDAARERGQPREVRGIGLGIGGERQGDAVQRDRVRARIASSHARRGPPATM